MFFLVLGTLLLFTRFRRAGRRIVTAAVGIFMLLGFIPLGFWLTTNLENRFPANPSIPADVAGIITLGGTINQYITAARGQPALTGGGERLTEFVHLARRYPDARLIFTGGSGALIDTELKEADSAQIFFDQMGLTGREIVFEDRARNTYENALFTREIVGDEAVKRRWVLITSAEHMPRAMGVFRQAGWNIMAYPVDYATDGRGGFELPVSTATEPGFVEQGHAGMDRPDRIQDSRENTGSGSITGISRRQLSRESLFAVAVH